MCQLKFVDQPFVLSVEAPWGWGKTTFLRMWTAELAARDAPVVSFNAWETDFSDAPLVSMLAELNVGIHALQPDTKGKAVFEGLRNAGSAVLKRAIPLAIRVGTSGLVSLSDDISEDIQKATTDLSERVAGDFVAAYSTAKDSLKDFKQKLAAVAEELKTRAPNGFPLTIFIDELDRCRPDYAVGMLEVVKHLFDVPGVVFVLAIHREQLEHSVRALYGSEMDADEYLRRFIDLSFKLPAPDAQTFVPAVMSGLGLDKELERRLDPQRRFKAGDPGQLQTALVNLFDAFAMSLRTQEQVLGQLSLVLRMTPDNKELFPEFLALLLTLSAVNRPMYEKYVAGEASGADLIDWIASEPKRRKFVKTDTGIGVEGWLRMCDVRQIEEDPVAKYRTLLDDENANVEDREHASRLIPFCDWINNQVLHYGSYRGSSLVEALARKIALLEQFSPETPE